MYLSPDIAIIILITSVIFSSLLLKHQIFEVDGHYPPQATLDHTYMAINLSSIFIAGALFLYTRLDQANHALVIASLAVTLLFFPTLYVRLMEAIHLRRTHPEHCNVAIPKLLRLWNTFIPFPIVIASASLITMWWRGDFYIAPSLCALVIITGVLIADAYRPRAIRHILS